MPNFLSVCMQNFMYGWKPDVRAGEKVETKKKVVIIYDFFSLTLGVNHGLYPWYRKAYSVEQSNKNTHSKHDIIFKV